MRGQKNKEGRKVTGIREERKNMASVGSPLSDNITSLRCYTLPTPHSPSDFTPTVVVPIPSSQPKAHSLSFILSSYVYNTPSPTTHPLQLCGSNMVQYNYWPRPQTLKPPPTHQISIVTCHCVGATLCVQLLQTSTRVQHICTSVYIHLHCGGC